jgi:LPPG:FO 2-phospho-L-lactate transferase
VSGRVVVLTGGVGGAAAAQVAPGVVEALRRADTRAVRIAPSNPFLSIDPILAVPGIRAALMDATAPVVAVAPIVGAKP